MRPKVKDPECIKYVAEELTKTMVENGDKDEKEGSDDIVEVLSKVRDWDGYSLARELESRFGYSPDEYLVDTLSHASLLGIRWVEKAVKEWVIQEKIVPKLALYSTVKTRLGEGPIEAVRAEVAEYVVATGGHKYVLPFEEVEAS